MKYHTLSAVVVMFERSYLKFDSPRASIERALRY